MIFLTTLLISASFGTLQDLPLPISAATDYAHLREGVNAPRLLHSVDPDYTPQALQARIEGTVVLQAVIDKSGKVAYASVLSPLPAGLDTRALAAVTRWKYSPGVMDNEIIPVLTTIDVLFKLPYEPVKQDADQLRKAFQQNVRSKLDLAKAEISRNPTEAWKLVEEAAYWGNAEAQQMMGDKYESARNPDAARRYFRLCAASGHAACEYRLGKLMVSGPGLNPNDFTQGITWLELAKEHGNQPASQLWTAEVAKLSSIQRDWVAQLKPHLELRNFKGF